MIRPILVLSTTLAGMPVSAADGLPPATRAVVAQRLALTVGGKTIDVSGSRDCTYTRSGSIYDLPSAIWSVQQTLAKGRLNLTVFRPAKGGDMISIMVTLDNKVHQVSTVKVGANGTIRGSGTIRVTTSANGGTFNIDATASDGVRISGTITCPSFRPPEDNG